MNKYPEEMIEGMCFVFEDIDDDTTFQGAVESLTWKQLKEQHKARFTKAILSALTKAGFKRIEIGSHAWYSYRKKTKGRFIPLDTMFVARLLKR